MPLEKKASSEKPYDVTIVEVEPRMIAAAKGWAKMSNVSQQMMAAMDVVWKFVKEHKIENDGQNVAIYRMEAGKSFEKDGCAIFAGPGIKKPFDGNDQVVVDSTPGGRAALCRHTGAYSGIHLAHDAIHQWAAQNGNPLQGDCWEVYGHWTNDESQLVTDIYYHLKD